MKKNVLDKVIKWERKPQNMSEETLGNNLLLVKNKKVKELLRKMEQINYYSSKNIYWEIGMKSCWRELKEIIDL